MTDPRLHSAFYLICFVLIQSATAHVSLTYPKARTLALDFLDNARTKGPCGEPDVGPVTNLLQGSTFNISWFLAYAHKGGVKFEILENDKPVRNLTPDYVEADDRTAQIYQVELPSDYTCEKCSIRLIRQALEWGDEYSFWSCGRVNIQAAATFTRTCSGKGTFENGKCKCEKRYSGEDCQNEDDCADNTDCGSNGDCVDTKGSNYPKKQCYCQPGWFGRQCEHESAVTTLKDFNTLHYAHKELRSGFDLYYRVIDENEGTEQMEIVLQVESDSYVSLGWKPKDSNKDSQTEEEGKGEPEGEPKHGSEPEGETEGELGKCTGHYMDCTDIVIGTARGNLSRIMDYYTRDRSTPREDKFYGGNNHLTAAIGEEKDGKTTILFRKPVEAKEREDHSFQNDLMTVIYAYGQANPRAGLTENAGSNPDFYKKDELKYHGGNRGHTDINFFSLSTVTKRLAFKLMMNWDPDLANEDSQTTKDLDSKIITELENKLIEEFSDTPNEITKVTRIEYSEGSVVVIVDVEASVAAGHEDTFDEQLENNMKNIGNLGGAEVDKDSITVSESSEEQSSGLETWAIVLIVIACLIAIALIAVIVYCCCCKSGETDSTKTQRKYTNQEKGTENPNYETTNDELPRGYTPCSRKDFDNLASFNVK